jgi:hypothetical protein
MSDKTCQVFENLAGLLSLDVFRSTNYFAVAVFRVIRLFCQCGFAFNSKLKIQN